jgi:hypothetical protein
VQPKFPPRCHVAITRTSPPTRSGTIEFSSTSFDEAERAMKYLCLVYFDEQTFATTPGRPSDPECFAFGEGVRESGQYVAAEALQPVKTAKTVRVRNGKASITDGPFAETKEQLGGFYLIEAGDMNEALQLAAQIPPARVGSIDVRPIRALDLS